MSRMVRDIEVGIRGAGGAVEREVFTVPESDLDGRAPQVQLLNNPKITNRFYVDTTALLWAKIGDAYDPDQVGHVISERDE